MKGNQGCFLSKRKHILLEYLFFLFPLIQDVFRVHRVVLRKKKQKENSSPGLQADKRSGRKNAVLDFS